MPVVVHKTPSGVSNWISAFVSPPIFDIEGDKIVVELKMKVENFKLILNDNSF